MKPLAAYPVSHIFMSLTVFLSGVLFLALETEMDLHTRMSLSVCMIILGAWATGIMAEHITSVVFFGIALTLKLAPAGVIFSGFESNTFWLLFGGLIIGNGVQKSGLGKRFSQTVLRVFETNYAKLIGGIILLAMLLGFLIPAALGRMVLLITLATALADNYGLQKGTPGRSGLFYAAILGTFLPMFGVLTANVPTIIFVGSAEATYGIRLFYGDFLISHFPIIGILKSVILYCVIMYFYPAHLSLIACDITKKPFTRTEIKAGIILIFAVLMWLTDSIHQTASGQIALMAAGLMVFPGLGPMEIKELRSINYNPLIIIAGIMGFGALINHVGLGGMLATQLAEIIPFSETNDFLNTYYLSLLGFLTAPVTTLPAVSGILTPLAETLAEASGLPLLTVLQTQLAGFNHVLLPYTAPVIMIGIKMAGENIAEAAKIMLVMALIGVFFILPLHILWWNLIG